MRARQVVGAVLVTAFLAVLLAVFVLGDSTSEDQEQSGLGAGDYGAIRQLMILAEVRRGWLPPQARRPEDLLRFRVRKVGGSWKVVRPPRGR